MRSHRLGARSIKLLAVIAGTAALGACSTAGSYLVQTQETPQTGTQIATAIDAPPGSNQDFILNVGRRLYFTQNSTELSDEARVTLDKQADWLARYTAYKVKIEGFADEPGSAEHNKQVGLKRAEAALAYLASQGIAPERMRVKSFGNQRDRMTNTCGDTSCRSQNRRVVTVLEAQAGA